MLAVVGAGRVVVAQEGVFLTEEQAPAAVFPDGETFEREVVPGTPELRSQMRAALGQVQPSLWEDQYVTFKVLQDGTLRGRAVIVEEIGKHRPITFVVGVRPDGRVNDVAVMAYREAYGGEVKNKRFLGQYRSKAATDGFRPHDDITNIAGATLSVEAASRAVQKALALVRVAFGTGGPP
jgi:FMN-binding protein